MNKIGTTSGGAVIVEMTKEEFEALMKIQGAVPATIGAAKTEKTDCQTMSHSQRVSYILERLKKLHPNTRTGVVHSIQAMFHFNGGIESDEINKVIATLVKRKIITIASNGKVTYL